MKKKRNTHFDFHVSFQLIHLSQHGRQKGRLPTTHLANHGNQGSFLDL